MNERENELTYERIKQMPSWRGSFARIPEEELSLGEIDTKPLWEIDQHVESTSTSKTAEQKFISEGVLHENSPWLKTIDLMNKHFYTNEKRAVNSNYAARSAMRWAEDIERRVNKLVDKGRINEEDKDYLVDTLQEQASNKVFKDISDAKPEKLDEWRKKGAGRLLRNVLADDPRFNHGTKRPDPVRGFVEKRSSPTLESKPENFHEDSSNTVDVESVNHRVKYKRQLTVEERARKAAMQFLVVYIPAMAALGSWLNNTNSKEQEEVDKWFATYNAKKSEQAAGIIVETLEASTTPESFSILDKIKTPEPINIIPEQATFLTQNQRVNVYSATEIALQPEITEVVDTENIVIPATPEPDFYHAGTDFSNSQRTTIEIAGVTISTIPMVHKDIFNSMEVTGFEESTASGTDKSQIYIDKYGNTIWGIHSGTDGGRPNPGEELRKKIQVGSIDDPYSYLNEADTLANINKLLKPGDPVYIEQDNGTKRAYQVVAVGAIPDGSLNDEFYSDKKNATDNVIEATGGVDSDFNVFTEQRGVIVLTCLHNVGDDPEDPNYKLIDPTGDTFVIGFIPTNESYTENEAETIPLNHEAEAKMHPLERSARILTQILNSASSRTQDIGEKLKTFLTDQFRLHELPITDEVEDVIRDVSRETEDGDKIQCTMGPDLLGTMPGSEGTVKDTYGWQDNDENGNIIRNYDEAADFITRADDTMDPVLAGGGRINHYGAEIFKVDSFSGVNIGDKITVPRSPALPNGHVVIVIGKWLDDSGKTHLKIFDVNYERNFGLARILEDVTEDNIYDQIAKGQKLSLYAVRPQTPPGK